MFKLSRRKFIGTAVAGAGAALVGVVDAFVVGVESLGHVDELLDGTQLALNELGYRAAPAA